ncbi:MAG TPA: hypothetical protein VKR61_07765 [Bryobacteraceae bacterium]|nr:hypothetical protein [Bryobacteraceae bacterium]
MRKRLDKLRRLATESEARIADESAGQQLSPEEQERASLKRIMAEMGHHAGRRGGHARGPKPPHAGGHAPGRRRPRAKKPKH